MVDDMCVCDVFLDMYLDLHKIEMVASIIKFKRCAADQNSEISIEIL